MEFLPSLSGLIQLRMTAPEPASILETIRNMNIRLYQVGMEGEFAVTFWVMNRDYGRITVLAEKHGCELQKLDQRGVYWTVRVLLARKILLAAMILLVGLTLWLPTRVLFISVEGNSRVPAGRILEAAAESGVSFGAPRKKIRSEQTKNSLLSSIPELRWIGVNTYGCRAVISVRERTDSELTGEHPGISNMIAAQDGVILSATVTDGTGLCEPGDAVRAGQILISGYSDCGRTIRATRAQGDIFAQTERMIRIIMPAERKKRVGESQEIRKYSLLIGKKRINFYKGSGIYDASCVKMYSKYVLTLPGGYQLPVAWITEELHPCSLSEEAIVKSVGEGCLQSAADRYLNQNMVAGSILERAETFTASADVYCLAGRYLCQEMIGREQEEQIGEYNGKSDGTDRERGSGG